MAKREVSDVTLRKAGSLAALGPHSDPIRVLTSGDVAGLELGNHQVKARGRFFGIRLRK